VPTILTCAALVMKIIAFALEHKDVEDLGDDYGALILFLLTAILSIWLFMRSKKAAVEFESPSQIQLKD
jgi:hypothetical protein